jgi:5-(carboxyamino)imidazole ribonucleotide mutase
MPGIFFEIAIACRSLDRARRTLDIASASAVPLRTRIVTCASGGRSAGQAPVRAFRRAAALEYALLFGSTGVDKALVGIAMGSQSDWAVMQHAAQQLEDFGVPFEARIVSAHRTPDLLYEYAEAAAGRGLRCIIAGAGGSAHLPGMLAAKTIVPVLGVPVPTRHLKGLDSLLSIVQMPKGIPVATFAVGEAGAANAGLFAVALLARDDARYAKRLEAFRRRQPRAVRAMKLPK